MGRATGIAGVVGWLVVAGCGGGETPSTPDAAADTGIDSGAPAACRSDADCDDHAYCTGIERCNPSASGADTRGCVLGTAPCSATQRCDEGMGRCVATSCGGAAADADGDTHRSIDCGGDDCDDADPNRHPGNAESCDTNMHDEDCDPTTYGYRDSDGDGVPDARCCNVDASGTASCGTDCNDMGAAVHPGAVEACNGVDDDCDSATDEGVRLTFYADADADGYGDVDPAADTTQACFAPAGFVDDHTDCDDADNMVHPGAAEVCDAPDGGAPRDENCDGMTNPPSLCTCSGMGSQPCPLPGRCGSGTQNCSNGHWTDCSILPATETCNGVDDDCDGVIDNGVLVPCFADGDDDGYPAASAAMSDQCRTSGRPPVHGECPPGYTARAPLGADIDCRDADATIHPGATEVCDGLDSDCSSGGATASDEDGDGDMHAPPTAGCVGGFARDDCNDAVASIHPGATEICDRVDSNCSNGVSPGGVAMEEDVDGDGHAPSPTTVCSSGPGGLPVDDCNDTNANVHPGQTAYFADPICSIGISTCSTSGTTVRVCGTCLCAGSCTPSSWDYDCSGTSDRAPSRTTCGIAIVCSGDCADAFEYTGTPQCSAAVATMHDCMCTASGLGNRCTEPGSPTAGARVPCR
ncbi:MAG: putative metal-binding motif-containing protein [Sandaracinus sp.]